MPMKPRRNWWVAWWLSRSCFWSCGSFVNVSKRAVCAEEISDGKIDRRTVGGGMLVGGSEGAFVGSAGAATCIVDFGRAGMMELGRADVAMGATLSKSSHASSS